MGALGDIVNSAVGAMTDNKSGTSLDDFLTHFSSTQGTWVATIDPYNTFDVSMKFHPDANDASGADGGKKEKKTALEKLGDSLVSSAKSAVKNAANNLTGGLLGSIMESKVKVTELRDSFEQRGQESFMEYLAAANMLVGQDDWVGESAGQAVRPLEIQLGLYCQSITIPSISNASSGTSDSLVGQFPINGNVVKPDSNELQMTIVNTKVPLLERIFYPWLREVTLPYWAYQVQPYTTADITVDFTKHCDMKYVFYGCRPSKIFNPRASQQNGDLTRDVTMLFDYLVVKSKLNNNDTAAQKLLSGGKTLFNGVSNMLNA